MADADDGWYSQWLILSGWYSQWLVLTMVQWLILTMVGHNGVARWLVTVTTVDHSRWYNGFITMVGHSSWSQWLITMVDHNGLSQWVYHNDWSQWLITMADHNGWSQWLITMVYHNDWSQRLTAMVDHNGWSQWLITVVDHSAWSQWLITVLGHNGCPQWLVIMVDELYISPEIRLKLPRWPRSRLAPKRYNGWCNGWLMRWLMQWLTGPISPSCFGQNEVQYRPKRGVRYRYGRTRLPRLEIYIAKTAGRLGDAMPNVLDARSRTYTSQRTRPVGGDKKQELWRKHTEGHALQCW